ncbi:tRNA glutamyl-Q(34) synthetase GluQRS [uncultured Roseovarius sp.]|uniref:tRNA glutamyl-Q(34) synthetase GluQRS n=1 Tax=uncultured Roseovarius sp. TaxID=293344 RepID=UPI002608C39A|nr:tRNA glutamyl-Q(34) synthetase GluQRS [uncultured Roseovarius sp.]
MFITRFAPSPTGPLHLGHAYSAILAYDRAQAEAGTFLLRIDDLDQTRCRSEWEVQIFDDLAWLGLDWPRPVLRQSTRLPRYRAALKSIWHQGLIYPCSCSRADIRAAASAPQEGAPLLGPDGVIYPGTCRPATPPQGPMPEECALRLDMARACRMLSSPLIYKEKDRIITPHNLPHTVGDVVLARREMGASYHLSVVVDDADQGITHVIRGEDLQEATQIHVLLQRLLGLPTPAYHHHALIRDAAGRRLAKRDDARAIATYRAEGASPSDIRALLGL